MSGLVADNIFKASGVIAAAAGGLSWQPVVTSNFSAAAGKGYWVNTTSNTITITLPSSPSVGDEVTIMDGSASNGFATNNVTVGRGGSKIEGATSDDTLATNNQCVTLIFANAAKGWLYKSTNQ